MTAQFDELHQPVRRETRERQAGIRQFVEVVIVELIAMPVALVDHVLAVEGVHQRPGTSRASCAPGAWSAEFGCLVAHLLPRARSCHS